MNNCENDKFCMSFTNEDIKEYFIKPLSKHSNLNLRLLSTDGTELFNLLRDKITFVCFDGKRENFYIRFYGYLTAIFISDEELTPHRKYTFNEEFMFIDDDAKEHIVSSDTHGNVVYEGSLRDKSHKEILALFCDFVKILIGAINIKIEETMISQEGWQYPKCKYVVNLAKNDEIHQKIEIENIIFIIN